MIHINNMIVKFGGCRPSQNNATIKCKFDIMTGGLYCYVFIPI